VGFFSILDVFKVLLASSKEAQHFGFFWVRSKLWIRALTETLLLIDGQHPANLLEIYATP